MWRQILYAWFQMVNFHFFIWNGHDWSAKWRALLCFWPALDYENNAWVFLFYNFWNGKDASLG